MFFFLSFYFRATKKALRFRKASKINNSPLSKILFL